MKMNTDSVAEFLREVSLIQRLPSSSLSKIAELLQVEHYVKGEFVIHKGESKGVYFILQGEAEVFVNSDDDIRHEFILKRYDYFGIGVPTSEQQEDVAALSKLTCLVLPSEHCCLLQPKQKTFPPIETILHLDPIEADLFQGITLPSAPMNDMSSRMFGGQFLGHALAAASKTVDSSKIVHQIHAYFLLAGDVSIPVKYEVQRIRDGKSFASRKVDALQKGIVVFTLLASFHKDEKGFERQEVFMPSVPAPETLLSMEELRERRIIDPRLPKSYRNKVGAAKHVPWPIEIRFCDPSITTNQIKTPPRVRYWLRAKGKLTDDQTLHRCVVAYAIDLVLIGVIANPHRQRGLTMNTLTVNHTMWFHRDVKADDWILFVIESPFAFGARGLVYSQMFNQNRELVVSLVQEGLVRAASTPQTTIKAKY
ncbi:hypothetical protein RND81_03G209700 [Saponaria officinalis]|uniref:Cyclic nucleotide-binding domain-containing protein n=1 Tax=Saponaria officinalis TaxID=3572 RepID=A0AAW1MAW1_SAPOF